MQELGSRADKRVTILNESTGECITFKFYNDDQIAHCMQACRYAAEDVNRIALGGRIGKDDEWAKVLLKAAGRMPEIVKTNDSYSTIMFAMISVAAYGGRIKASQSQIAEMSNKSISSVKRAISLFKKEGLIRNGEHEGRPYLFFTEEIVRRGKQRDSKLKPIRKAA